MKYTAIAIAILLNTTVSMAALGTRTITVTAGNYDYAEVPVSTLITPPQGFQGVNLLTSDGAHVPSQYQVEGRKIKLMWIVDSLKKGTSRKYKVAFSPFSKTSDPHVSIRKAGNTVEVEIGGRPFTTLLFPDGLKPYFYPIIGPTGDPVTRNYPMKKVEGETTDHPHHRSWWFAHGSVNGVDFWSESEKAGRIFPSGLEAAESGTVMGRIRTHNDWVDPDSRSICKDTREYRIYNISTGRLIDFDITIRATEGPVTFGDTKEGMMGFRVADSMAVDRGQGHIVNSRGQKDGDAWGMPAEWCDYYGPVNGKTVGIAVLDHPSSFRHPTYWHVRTYGLFAANPFGLKDFPNGKGKDGSYTIPEGGEMRFRYRILIHNGDTEQAGIGAAFDSYAHPPTVSVR